MSRVQSRPTRSSASHLRLKFGAAIEKHFTSISCYSELIKTHLCDKFFPDYEPLPTDTFRNNREGNSTKTPSAKRPMRNNNLAISELNALPCNATQRCHHARTSHLTAVVVTTRSTPPIEFVSTPHHARIHALTS